MTSRPSSKHRGGSNRRLSQKTPSFAVDMCTESDSDPDEVWDPKQEWEIESIEDECVNSDGIICYKVNSVAWKGWHRRDGTNTTWVKASSLENQGTCKAILANWKTRVERLRKEERLRTDISVEEFSTEWPTTLPTIEYKHGLIDGMPIPTDWAGFIEDTGLDWVHEMEANMADLLRESPKEDKSSRSKPSFDDIQVREKDTMEPTTSKPRAVLRERIQSAWDRATSAVGATRVIIINDFDDEEIPASVDGNFVYVEHEYILGPGVGPDRSWPALVKCDCESFCDEGTVDECDCQAPSHLRNATGQRVLAYGRISDKSGDRKIYNLLSPRLRGLMKYTVIECNAKCVCTNDCTNRVAQLPRDVPLEVFKSRNRGWAVRATEALPQGKVIGFYTGELIPREADRDSSYIFNIDTNDPNDSDIEDEHEERPKFSVDSRHCGNWARFLNHSCNPNLMAYSVAFDTIPESGRQKLAFVARKKIPARMELSIDYQPKRSGRSRARNGRIDELNRCKCGEVNCRGTFD